MNAEVQFTCCQKLTPEQQSVISELAKAAVKKLSDDCPFLEPTSEQLRMKVIYDKLEGDKYGHRIMNRRQVTESGCWEYHGWKDGDGYRKIRVRGQGWYVHRYVWTLVNGHIPRNGEIEHKCLNRACFNPDHLKRGTRLTNMREMHIRKKKNERKKR